MVIRTTATEIDLSGTPAELRAVADVLRSMMVGTNFRFDADPTADPAPYDRVLGELEVFATDGLVRVWVADNKLLAAGSPDTLESFAVFFQFLDGTPRHHHAHFEWYPGNDFIAADSRPLVIRIDYPPMDLARQNERVMSDP